MRLALADAGVQPADVVHVNAHGTSTPLNDAAEAQAVAAVFGPYAVPVTQHQGRHRARAGRRRRAGGSVGAAVVRTR